ncbi:MAG: alcohol dehydrogenase family protein [Acidimicrobiales bacterium]|nr:alcohol dehydrogenase family protein [Acidimicrobiales bacterium]
MSTVPDYMTALHLVGNGGPEKLVLRHDVPVPVPTDDEVLVRVRACAMNNTDVNTRVGWYSKSVTGPTATEGFTDEESMGDVAEDAAWGGSGLTFPRIQGADPCGEVVAVGAASDPDLLGRRVLADGWIRDASDPSDRSKAGYLGSERDGGYAQYCAIPVRNVYPVDPVEGPPLDLTDVELASFPCSWATAEHMLTRSGVGSEETVVVTGASGGVGSALVQLAGLRGARVVAVTAASKFDALYSIGADVCVDRDAKDLASVVVEAAAGLGRVPGARPGRVDVLADVVGGPDFVPLLEVISRGGRYTTAGAIAGPIVDLDLRTLYLNDLDLYGCTVYEPSVFDALMGYIKRGEVRPVVAASWPLADFHAAQEAFSAKSHVGAMVVEIP